MSVLYTVTSLQGHIQPFIGEPRSVTLRCVSTSIHQIFCASVFCPNYAASYTHAQKHAGFAFSSEMQRFGFQPSNCKTNSFFFVCVCVCVNFLCHALVAAMAELLLIRRDAATQCPRLMLFPFVWETNPLLKGNPLRVAISERTVETHKKQNSTTHSGGERWRVFALHSFL